MSIKRITVEFVGPDGVGHASATGPTDRHVELIREARERLERFKATARQGGDPLGTADFTLVIKDAPDAREWRPRV